MELYKIYKYQAEVLEGLKDSNGIHYNPITDINGDYFITEQEHLQCGLGELTEFVPPPLPEELIQN